MGKLAKRPVTPTQTPGSRIKAPKIGGVSRARLSGQKMNEGAGKRGKARQQRQQTMAIQRQMLGRIKPGKSAEPLSTGGTLAARASLRRARAKAGPGASPAQRGAVKRAGTYLKASKERNRAAVKGAASRGTVAKPKGLKQGAVTVSPQKQRLANAAKRRNAQADKLDAKVSQLQKQYRDKGTAFYTQPVKTPGRDAMYRKMEQANKLREESAALRTKAQNAQRMSDKIKAKPAKVSGGNTKMARAIANEQTYSQRPKAKRRNSRATALRAQEIYKKNDPLANVGLYDMAKRGFRLPRDQRRKA